MIGLPFIIVDAILAVVASVATYFSIAAATLYEGDIMHRIFVIAGLGFAIVMVFSIFDILLRFWGIEMSDIPLVRGGVAVSITCFSVALASLVRWGRTSLESNAAE